MSDAREVAVKALYAVERGAWSDEYLDRAITAGHLDRRDAALATAICSGVLQNRALLDYWIAGFSSQRLNKISPYVLNILRAALYQMRFMDKIPHSAAVNTAVAMARRGDNPRVGGFVNAVLRRLSENIDALPEPVGEDTAGYLALKYSHPRWLAEYFINRVGEAETETLLDLNNRPADICARVNSLKADRVAAIASLEADGVVIRPHEYLTGALYMSHTGSIAELAAYREGLITVQDASSQLCALVLAPEPGSAVLDVCAAPGGKSFAMADLMRNRGAVAACDVSAARLSSVTQDAERLGADIVSAITMDATVRRDNFTDKFDYILVDVPCSGMGTIRRKPEIRYKKPDEIAKLPELQMKILENVAGYLKIGGVMVYSTCSLLSEENEAVAQSFLASHDAFAPEDFSLPGGLTSRAGMLTLWPQRHGGDGFFIAKFRRRI